MELDELLRDIERRQRRASRNAYIVLAVDVIAITLAVTAIVCGFL